MPIITFWSGNEKAIGQTIAASVTAITMAMNYNYKILLISADFNDEMLEMSFGAQESNKKILNELGQKGKKVNLGSGIEGIMKLANSNRVTPELVHDYTKIIFNRLEALYAPIIREKMEDEEDNTYNSENLVMSKLKQIITNAANYYDQVIIDLKKGIRYQEQLDILHMSDVIVMNVDQRIDSIEKTMNMEEFKKNKKKIIWNICKYDKNSKYNTKNLLRAIMKKEEVFDTPYNTLIAEATQEAKLAETMIRFRTIKNNGENLEFITKSKKLVEEILLKYQEVRTMI